MVIVFETSSGKRMPEMAPGQYAYEISPVVAAVLPERLREALPAISPRLAEHESARSGTASPFADPSFIARVCRSEE